MGFLDTVMIVGICVAFGAGAFILVTQLRRARQDRAHGIRLEGPGARGPGTVHGRRLARHPAGPGVQCPAPYAARWDVQALVAQLGSIRRRRLRVRRIGGACCCAGRCALHDGEPRLTGTLASVSFGDAGGHRARRPVLRVQKLGRPPKPRHPLRPPRNHRLPSALLLPWRETADLFARARVCYPEESLSGRVSVACRGRPTDGGAPGASVQGIRIPRLPRQAARRVLRLALRFQRRQLDAIQDMPNFLLPLRERAAAFAGLSPSDLQQVLLTEYRPGAAIGWHKDRSVFGRHCRHLASVGVHLPAAAQSRNQMGARIDHGRAALSVYLLHGPSRTEWEHSIPAVDQLRYSVIVPEFWRHVRRRKDGRMDATAHDGDRSGVRLIALTPIELCRHMIVPEARA